MADEPITDITYASQLKQIQLQLGCSKSTISYHCNQQTKDKTKVRTKKEI